MKSAQFYPATTGSPDAAAWFPASPVAMADMAGPAWLDVETSGVHAQLLCLMALEDSGSLPDDDAAICRMLGIEQQAWLGLRSVLVSAFPGEACFLACGGRIRHRSLDRESLSLADLSALHSPALVLQ